MISQVLCNYCLVLRKNKICLAELSNATGRETEAAGNTFKIEAQHITQQCI